MAQDREETFKQLSCLWDNDTVSVLKTKNYKYAILSDLHFGDGGPADDFRDNIEPMKRLLTHYLENNYRIILLGDIEELWQFDLDMIEKEYDEEIYSLFRKFETERIIRVFGNHDKEWASSPDPTMRNPYRAKGASEALKMYDVNGDCCILLVHGHQGSLDADKYSWISKCFVRGILKPLEPVARWLKLYGNPSVTKSKITKDYEQIMYAWAKENKVIFICGHSHRAIFASTSYIERLENKISELRVEIKAHKDDHKLVKENKNEIKRKRKNLKEEKKKGRDIDPTEPDRKPLPCYFNTGCGIFTTGITCLEIDNDEIRLVKWHKDKKEESFYEIYERDKLSEFLRITKGS